MTHILIPTGGFPPDIGGPATYVPRIATALIEQGHTVTVITLTPAQAHHDDDYPFSIVRISTQRNRILRWINVVFTLLKRMKTADLVYVNGLLMETAVASLFRPRRMIAKVVGDIVWERAQDKGWINDSIDVFQTQSYDRRIELRRTIRNWAIQQMNQVIVPSRYLQKIVAGWGVQTDKIDVVYNAIQPMVKKATVTPHSLPCQHQMITVCRLVRWKQVDALIGLLPDLPDIGLLIVGDGAERERLETLGIELGVNCRLHFTDHLAPENVYAYLQSADLFVLNSTYEGLPHVILEALAVGLPIVATAVGGVPELVQNGINGQLIPVGQPDALKLAIINALANKLTPLPLDPKFMPETMINHTIQILEGTHL